MNGTPENRPNTDVARDANGGFSAGNITSSGRITASELRAQTTNDADAASPLLRLRSPLESLSPPGDRFRVDSGGGLLVSSKIGYGRIRPPVPAIA